MWFFLDNADQASKMAFMLFQASIHHTHVSEVLRNLNFVWLLKNEMGLKINIGASSSLDCSENEYLLPLNDEIIKPDYHIVTSVNHPEPFRKDSPSSNLASLSSSQSESIIIPDPTFDKLHCWYNNSPERYAQLLSIIDGYLLDEG
ncbi:hypothetical protein Tco_0621490 [Tanacetum coccineum]